MENNLHTDDIFDKFLNSDPDFIKSIMDEFSSLIGEGPTVSEYFERVESEYELFAQSNNYTITPSCISLAVDYYNKGDFELKYNFENTGSVDIIKVSVPSYKVSYSPQHVQHNYSFPLAA